MLSVTSSASAVPAEPRMLDPKRSAVSVVLVISVLPVDLFRFGIRSASPLPERDDFALSVTSP
jgi:hypothetical protein